VTERGSDEPGSSFQEGGEIEQIHASDLALARRIEGGDETAFVALIRRHHAGFMRLATVWVRSPSVAEDVVQETWLVVLERLGEFQGRSALKTWLCGILVNIARSRARRENKLVPFDPLTMAQDLAPETAVPAERFSPPGHRWDGHWQRPPRSWAPSPEAVVITTETLAIIERCLEELPAQQKAVLLFRDVEDLSAEEVCNALGISSTHQRVLLHRARSRMRALLEPHYDQRKGSSS